MKRVVAVIEGEKIGLEKVTRDNKVNVSLHMLAGYESMKMSVRDASLVSVKIHMTLKETLFILNPRISKGRW